MLFGISGETKLTQVGLQDVFTANSKAILTPIVLTKLVPIVAPLADTNLHSVPKSDDAIIVDNLAIELVQG